VEKLCQKALGSLQHAVNLKNRHANVLTEFLERKRVEWTKTLFSSAKTVIFESLRVRHLNLMAEKYLMYERIPYIQMQVLFVLRKRAVKSLNNRRADEFRNKMLLVTSLYCWREHHADCQATAFKFQL